MRFIRPHYQRSSYDDINSIRNLFTNNIKFYIMQMLKNKEDIMEEIKLELFNEIIHEVALMTSSEFSNLFNALKAVNDELEDFHQEEIKEFIEENLNLENESELSDLADYERESLVDFINTLY